MVSKFEVTFSKIRRPIEFVTDMNIEIKKDNKYFQKFFDFFSVKLYWIWFNNKTMHNDIQTKISVTKIDNKRY